MCERGVESRVRVLTCVCVGVGVWGGECVYLFMLCYLYPDSKKNASPSWDNWQSHGILCRHNHRFFMHTKHILGCRFHDQQLMTQLDGGESCLVVSQHTSPQTQITDWMGTLQEIHRSKSLWLKTRRLIDTEPPCQRLWRHTTCVEHLSGISRISSDTVSQSCQPWCPRHSVHL